MKWMLTLLVCTSISLFSFEEKKQSESQSTKAKPTLTERVQEIFAQKPHVYELYELRITYKQIDAIHETELETYNDLLETIENQKSKECVSKESLKERKMIRDRLKDWGQKLDVLATKLSNRLIQLLDADTITHEEAQLIYTHAQQVVQMGKPKIEKPNVKYPTQK